MARSESFAQPGWLLGAIGGLDNLASFSARLQHMDLQPDMLPLVATRKILSQVSLEAIQSYCLIFDRYPEILSRYGRLIRDAAQVHQACPTDYIVHEAHVDISETPSSLRNKIVGLGFEEDHFHTLNPPEYRDCFTLRLEVPLLTRQRSSAVKQLLRENMGEVEHQLNNSPGVFAYSEIEAYSSENKCKYIYTPPTNDALAAFPFKHQEFQPSTKTESKKADLHIKIPAAWDCDEGQQRCRHLLKAYLLGAGFYEIRSLSGNIIYTIQMLSVERAEDAFRSIKRWADEFKCIKGIELEVCSHFWRKVEHLNGGDFVSPIPVVIG